MPLVLVSEIITLSISLLVVRALTIIVTNPIILKKNDLFLISPGDVTFYEADKEDPWHYVWVGFNGIKATQYLDLIGLNRDNPILTTKNPDYIETCLHSIFESSKIIRGGEVRMLGNLYLFLSKLIEETKPAQQSNEKKDDYIQKSYYIY